MKCSEVKKLMLAYINGELNGNIKRDFEEHIKKCDLCKKEYELLLNFSNQMMYEDLRVPPETDFRTIELIKKEEEKSFFGFITKFLYPIIFTAGLIIGILLGMSLSKKEESKTYSILKENTFYVEPYIQNIKPEEVLNERE